MGYTLKLISEHIEQDTDYLIEAKEDGSKSYKIKIAMVECILWKY